LSSGLGNRHFLNFDASILILVTAVICMSGCASIPLNKSASTHQSSATQSVRENLQDAADNVRKTRWTKPAKQTFVSRLTGLTRDSSETFSRDNAITEYIALLNIENDPEAVLHQDAQVHLKAVDTLILISLETATALDPRLDDVDTLEAAIVDFREIRSIYLAALKYFEKASFNGEASPRRGSLKAAFGARLSTLGNAADELADQAHSRHKATLVKAVGIPATGG